VLAATNNRRGRDRRASARLLAQVHWQAFRREPAAYLQGQWWRLRGLKLRSRHRLAALIGGSPLAYDLWLEQQEPLLRGPDPAVAADRFVPVIDCDGEAGELDATLASLQPAGVTREPILVGTTGSYNHPGAVSPDLIGNRVMASSDWLILMRAGDRLAEGAAGIYQQAISDDVVLLYGDDDIVTSSGLRHDPHLKPSWNPDLFEWHDFVTGACAVKASAVFPRELPERGWGQALVREAIACGPAPVHVCGVLHHRRSRPLPTLPAPSEAANLPSPPTVSIIIPTRNGLSLLRTCLDGIARTAYPSLEVIIVDNGSDDPSTLSFLREQEDNGGVRLLRMPGPFNYSALNNRAVELATGTYCCFLNNDVEVLAPDWLSHLVVQAQRRELGAVGARLLYPDGTIQHAGVVVGLGGGAGHAHRGLARDESGYFDRARLPQQVSAVTAACMVVERNKFLAVGGFDEGAFPVAFNDVDLCLRLNYRGWQSFYEPRATLVHHESKSRGMDRTPSKKARFEKELAALKTRWRTDGAHDPYHHPFLSPFSERFVLDLG
jgi:GT2 family glycosyltransferase